MSQQPSFGQRPTFDVVSIGLEASNSHRYLWMRLAVMNLCSNVAKLLPGQIRPPKPKGRDASLWGFISDQRSGRKSSKSC